MPRPLSQAGSSAHPLAHAAAAAALVIGVGLLGIQVSFAPSLMSPEENSGGRAALAAATATAMVECEGMPRRDAHLCTAQAGAEDRFQQAELESRYRGTASSALDARRARAAADRDIANAKCTTLAQGDRAACLLAARPLRGASHQGGAAR